MPRARLRPAFFAAILTAQYEDGTSLPMAQIARDCGFVWPQRLTKLLRAPTGVPISTRPNFERVARLLRYPTDQIFTETADTTPRLVRRVP